MPKRVRDRAKYMREFRANGGVGIGQESRPIDTATTRRLGFELRVMEQLPMLEWPTDLFSAVNGTQIVQTKKPDETICSCGCKQPHRNNVSRVVSSDGFGTTSRKIAWYRSMECRNKHMGIGR